MGQFGRFCSKNVQLFDHLRFRALHCIVLQIKTISKSRVHERQKPFECKICGASFVNNANLEVHEVLVHEEKKPFECTICDFFFKKSIFENTQINSS